MYQVLAVVSVFMEKQIFNLKCVLCVFLRCFINTYYTLYLMDFENCLFSDFCHE